MSPGAMAHLYPAECRKGIEMLRRLVFATLMICGLIQPSAHALAGQFAPEQDCPRRFVELFPGIRAERALGRALTRHERLALDRAIAQGDPEGYSASEVLSQNRILSRAGFSEPDIALLRKRGPLGNWVVRWEQPPPSRVALLELETGELDTKALEQLKAGKTLSYFVDAEDRVHLVKGEANFPRDALLAIANQERSVFAVEEAGTLRYDNAARTLRFRPSRGGGLSAGQDQALLARLTREHPGLRVERATRSGQERAQMLRCLDVLDAQASGKGYMLNKLLVDNAVFAAVVVGSDAFLGSNRFGTERGREVLKAELIGNNIGTLVLGNLTKHLMTSGQSFLPPITTRYGAGLLMTGVQTGIYSQVLQEDRGERSTSIAAFNALAFGPLRSISAHYIDEFMIERLPVLLHEACSQGGPAAQAIRIFLSPAAIRIYEKVGFMTLYYGSRQAIIGE
ncbi:MAG: hypothetical protein NDJ89_11205 [Oligoflexia bacterium]|nr:hypothetical protein [Oligoflexia bacterium]